MTILELLLNDKPRNASKQRIDKQYTIVKELMPQLEEARRYGYSWSQVCRAVEGLLRSCGKWNESWHCYDTEKIYRRILKEAEKI